MPRSHFPDVFLPLSLTDALALQQNIIDTARSDGNKPVAVCIVDYRGLQLCAATMDGTKPASTLNAHAKAVTCIMHDRDTAAFRFRRMGTDGGWTRNNDGWSDLDLAIAAKVNPIFCSWAGGALIRDPNSGRVLGAIGVSGREELEDQSLASLIPSGFWSA